MNLTNYLDMDPHLLMALINTELRNHASDLEDLVKTHDLNLEALVDKLEKAGYVYHPELHQFR